MLYSTDLTNSRWQFISKILNDQRKRKYSLRQILNALFYLNKTGCQWRMLPKTYPPFGICFYYYRQWTKKGVWHKINKLLIQLYREKKGRKASPSLGIIDSQTIKNSEWGVIDKGFDGYKRIQGRKRHIVVDVLGCILIVCVHAANIPDCKKAWEVLKRLAEQGYERLQTILADGGYRGNMLATCLQKVYQWTLKIVMIKEAGKFEVLPKRWIVERTFSWLQWNRRLSRDFECELDSAETQTYIANIYRLITKI